MNQAGIRYLHNYHYNIHHWMNMHPVLPYKVRQLVLVLV
jgi:hypothetical protein